MVVESLTPQKSGWTFTEKMCIKKSLVQIKFLNKVFFHILFLNNFIPF